MYQFKKGDKVKGTYLRYTIPQDVDSRVETPFTGTVTADFNDGSYNVEFENGDNFLIELYDEDKMELE